MCFSESLLEKSPTSCCTQVPEMQMCLEGSSSAARQCASSGPLRVGRGSAFRPCPARTWRCQRARPAAHECWGAHTSCAGTPGLPGLGTVTKTCQQKVSDSTVALGPRNGAAPGAQIARGLPGVLWLPGLSAAGMGDCWSYQVSSELLSNRDMARAARGLGGQQTRCQ